MRLRKVRALIGSACAAGFALYVVYRGCQIQTQQSQPYGQFTAQQIIDRTAPLCRRVAPQASHVAFSPEKTLIGVNNRVHRPGWTVSCEDEAGRHIAYFVWAADTGELCWAGHEARRTPPGRSAVLSRRAATAAAWGWLCALGMGGKVDRWRLASVQQSRGTWTVVWGAANRSASIQVDACFGDLLVAHLSQSSSP